MSKALKSGGMRCTSIVNMRAGISMRPLICIILLMILFLSQAVKSGEITDDDDYIKISYLPNKGDFYNGEPMIEMHADTLSLNKNKEIKKYYLRVKNLINHSGIESHIRKIKDGTYVTNIDGLHIAITSIEVSVGGKPISLSYSGESNLPEFARYEHDWLILYKDIVTYLINKIPVGH